jgi:hypothetical protein
VIRKKTKRKEEYKTKKREKEFVYFELSCKLVIFIFTNPLLKSKEEEN